MEAAENSERRRRSEAALETRRHMMQLLGQFLTKLNTGAPAQIEFQQSAEIVRLAIELARLRGKDSPEPFLHESARLLTKACSALRQERARPEREQKEAVEKRTQELAAELEATNVPFTTLCRPATEDEKLGSSSTAAHETFGFKTGDEKTVSFDWRVYRDERDFKELLEKHAKRIYDTTGEKLNPRPSVTEKTGQPSSTEAVRTPRTWAEKTLSDLGNRYWLPEEWRKKFLGVKSWEAAAAILKEYVAAATQVFGEHLWQSAKAGELDVVTLYSIYQTRSETYRTRGPKRVRSDRR